MTTAELTPVTIDRVIETMAGFDITLHKAEQSQVATANINGLATTFAVLGSVVIVRAESDAGIPARGADATWYLAANQLNSVTLGARAVIVDSFETLVIRTECSLSVSAGVSATQLSDGLRRSIDSVLSIHDAVRVVAEQLTEKMRSGQNN